MNLNIRAWFYNCLTSETKERRATVMALLGLNETQLFNRLYGRSPFTIAEQKLLTDHIGEPVDFEVKPKTKETAL